ncbi:MAG: DNA repair protein RecN [Oscillospiraceae bacterium]|nr:DNA repair protein RecN [Oscillospiraceae bacterium]
MLTLLHIENIAVVEEADITFEPGLNLLTGETGAGKSIIVDSLAAALGERASRELLRSGCRKAFVSALFHHAGEETLVQREIFQDGKNICKVNGKPVTVAQLRELGVTLAQIHGQHDAQGLLQDENHLGLLDLFARADTAPHVSGYRELAEMERAAAKLREDENAREQRADALRYCIEETENADVYAGEEKGLQDARKQIKNAEIIAAAYNAAYAALAGTDEAAGAAELLGEAARQLREAEKHGAGDYSAAERLDAMRYEAADAAETVRAKTDDLERFPWSPDAIEARLDLIYRLKHKYNVTADELPCLPEKWKRELADMDSEAERLRALEAEKEKAQTALGLLTAKLSKLRAAAANKLQKTVEAQLRDLDMAKVRFVVELSPRELCEHGADAVRFLLAANPGEDLKPLSKTASGGELARVMLAMKNALSDAEDIGTLIFDEIDSGVSGRAAQKVAEKLYDAARHRQVICVTHLPQIAAMADAHYYISKDTGGDRTLTGATKLDYEARVAEIARVIGGNEITEATLAGAGDLLEQAEKRKAQEGRGQ